MQVLCIDNLTLTFTNSYVCHNYYKKIEEILGCLNYFIILIIMNISVSSSDSSTYRHRTHCNITQRKMSATHHGQLTPTITKNLKLLCHNRINHSHRLQIGKQPAQSSARHKQMLHRNHQRTL